MRSDTYVHNFEHAVDSYFKGAHVSDYTKRNLFFEALRAAEEYYRLLEDWWNLCIGDQGFLTSL